MGMPLLRGRGIESTDRAGSAPVVVVNEAFARLYWPGQDPIGRRIKMGTADAETEWRTVVGLVRDSRYRELTNARPGVYVPYGQGIPVRPRYIALRAAAGPAVAASTVRRAIEDVEPGAVVVSAATMPGLLAAPLARPRFQSALLSSFGLLALVLSVVGTYGVLAFFVRQRTREIGIRMALGADAKNVRQFVLSHGLIVGITGVSIGMVGAIALGRVMRTILFEVSPADPLVLSLAAASLLAATLAATLVPTRLAARTDPLLVMRNE
jgi:hypothetical protein